MELPQIPENWREILLSHVDNACLRLNILETTLGNKIVNDAGFFPNIRKGGGCGLDKYRQVMGWFKKNTPQIPKTQRPPDEVNNVIAAAIGHE